MNIASLCQREVVSIDADAPLHDAATLMCEQHVGALVVVEAGEPPQAIGIVTDRDLTLQVLGKTDGIDRMTVRHLANSPPVAVSATASIREAATIMEQAGVRRLLVVDPDGTVAGLVSVDDVIEAIADELESVRKALRAGIRREESERSVIAVPARSRPVFPSYGTVAMQ